MICSEKIVRNRKELEESKEVVARAKELGLDVKKPLIKCGRSCR